MALNGIDFILIEKQQVCHNIEVVNINVTPPSGKAAVFNCVNMQGSNLRNITCA
jgi:hypothetical protein